VGTVLGIFLIRFVTGIPEKDNELLHAGTVTGVALVATVAEAISGKWDNSFIAISVWIILQATNNMK
jgi:hypothetical protein